MVTVAITLILRENDEQRKDEFAHAGPCVASVNLRPRLACPVLPGDPCRPMMSSSPHSRRP
jgi:hypothetical protein